MEKGKGILCKLEKGAPLSNSFTTMYLKIVLINIKIFSDHEVSYLGSNACVVMHGIPVFSFFAFENLFSALANSYSFFFFFKSQLKTHTFFSIVAGDVCFILIALGLYLFLLCIHAYFYFISSSLTKLNSLKTVIFNYFYISGS